MHGEMSASKLERIELCPGSFKLCQGVESVSSASADEGTELHAETFGRITGAIAADGETSPEVDFVLAAIQQLIGSEDYELRAEYEFDFDRLGIAELEPIGVTTADLTLFRPLGIGVVVDYKFGWRRVAPVERNTQIMAYALALQSEQQLESVFGCIIQPRLNRVDYEQIDLKQALLRIRSIIREAQRENAPLNPHPDACRYCPALAKCPALAHTASMLPLDKGTNELSPKMLGKYLTVAKQMKKWCGAVEQHCFAVAQAGGDIDGWMLAPGRKSRKWKDGVDAAALKALAEKIGKSPEVTQTELLSVAQIEKLWGKSQFVRDGLEAVVEVSQGQALTERE